MRRTLVLAAALLSFTTGPVWAQNCADLVPDPYALDGVTGMEASAQLVANSAPAIAACETDYDESGELADLLRLVFALAASDDREADARKVLAKGAHAGSPEALNMLAALYSNGVGGAVDQQQAFELFEQASELDFAVAKYNLAEMLIHGLTGMMHPPRARELLEQAAAAGVGEAQAVLGRTLVTGAIGQPDPLKGMAMVHRALDARAVNALTYASTSYEALVGTVDQLGDEIHQYAESPVAAGKLWEEYLYESVQNGDRLQMLSAAMVQSFGGTTAELQQLFYDAIEPPDKADRLHVWLRFSSATIMDNDDRVYFHIYNDQGAFTEYLGIELGPVLEELQSRLGLDG